MTDNRIVFRDLLTGGEPEARDGWIYLRIEGEPYQRGFQHGYHLASQIKEAIRVNRFLAEWDTGMQWDFFVEKANEFFPRHIDDEFTQELQGIADGACANRFMTSFEEILAWNGYQDLLGSWWPLYNGSQPHWFRNAHRCSAFIATGGATTDGNVVLAHNCWDRYAASDHYNIILDVRPSEGYRLIFQAPPGYIASTIDWWITGAGLVVAETTISGFSGFDDNRAPEFYRSRKASQYARSIDDWKNRMWRNNNGGYAGSWLVGDIRTGEIARIEMGLRYLGYEKKDDGYFSGYNVASDLRIRNQECSGDSYSDIRYNGARRLRFKELLEGRVVDIEQAKEIIADHGDVYLRKQDNPCSRTICGHLELDDARYGSHAGQGPYYPWGAGDGKVVDSTMAGNMSFQARWGHACGMPFDAKAFLRQHPQYDWLEGYMRDRPACNWQTFGGL
ncbi:MAG: phospholipase [Nitrospirae bacterium]|nr:phospholipase [Nitrospirota bacterium]